MAFAIVLINFTVNLSKWRWSLLIFVASSIFLIANFTSLSSNLLFWFLYSISLVRSCHFAYYLFEFLMMNISSHSHVQFPALETIRSICLHSMTSKRSRMPTFVSIPSLLLLLRPTLSPFHTLSCVLSPELFHPILNPTYKWPFPVQIYPQRVLLIAHFVDIPTVYIP